jgi:hypothetical protein
MFVLTTACLTFGMLIAFEDLRKPWQTLGPLENLNNHALQQNDHRAAFGQGGMSAEAGSWQTA